VREDGLNPTIVKETKFENGDGPNQERRRERGNSKPIRFIGRRGRKNGLGSLYSTSVALTCDLPQKNPKRDREDPFQGERKVQRGGRGGLSNTGIDKTVVAQLMLIVHET